MPGRLFLFLFLFLFLGLSLASVGSAKESAEGLDARQVERLDELELEDLLDLRVVELASMREQRQDEAPASTTVLTSADLRSLAIPNLAEALRVVPGFYVMQLHANDYTVNSRGVASPLNDRVLVLLDGQRINEPGSGTTLWSSLALRVCDVERVEVIRGPSGTFHGANATSGVINVITKSGKHAPQGAFASFEAGSLYRRREAGDLSVSATLANTGGGSVGYRYRSPDEAVHARAVLGFQHQTDWLPTGEGERTRHGPFGYYVLGTATVDLTERWSLRGRINHAMGEGLFSRGPSQPLVSNGLNSEQAMVLSARGNDLLEGATGVSVQIDMRRLRMYRANENARGLIELEPITREAHGRLQVDHESWGGVGLFSLALEGGASSSRPYFIGEGVHGLHAAVAAQAELRLWEDRLLATAAGRLERIALTPDGREGTIYRNANPRLALVWKPAPGHALRASVSNAYRTPALLEAYLSVQMDAYGGGVPPVTFVKGDPRLRPELTRSVELAHDWTLGPSLSTHLGAYVQSIENLTDVDSTARLPGRFRNHARTENLGMDAGLRWRLGDAASGFVSYTGTHYLDRGERIHLFPRHLLKLGTTLRRGSFDFSAWLQYARHLPVRFLEGRTTGDPQPRTRRARQARQILCNLRLAASVAEETASVFLAARNVAAFFLDTVDLRQFPAPMYTPIGGSIIVGVEVSP